MTKAKEKPRLGLYSLTSCSGDILEITNLEEDLLKLLDLVEVVDLNVAMPATGLSPDIALVEGAVTQAEEAGLLRGLRKKVKYLVAIGTCACTGGVVARGPKKRKGWLRDVYPETGGDFTSGFPRPVSDVVPVDFSIPGCPIERNYLMHCLGYLLKGVVPEVPNYPLCMECKMKGNECLLRYRGLPCLGPVTRAGCGARQPSVGRPCDGCFGAYEDANREALTEIFRQMGLGEDEIKKRFDLFWERG
ncbi:NAD-reducing hydrogenase HoxS subunit delta [bacterium BMS3Bbin07]|nr:NAD-reducing hydrogenase HoxS subunit delta [bacterium BMS3Bbin07]